MSSLSCSYCRRVAASTSEQFFIILSKEFTVASQFALFGLEDNFNTFAVYS